MVRRMMAVLVVGGMLTVPVFAGGPHSQGEGAGHDGGKALAELNLSQAQKDQLKALRLEMRDFRVQNMTKLKDLREKGKTELLKDTPDRNVLSSYTQQASVVMQAMADKEVEHLLKVKTVLTKDQFAKLLSREFLMEMGGGPWKKHGTGPDGRHGDKPAGPKHDDDK